MTARTLGLRIFAGVVVLFVLIGGGILLALNQSGSADKGVSKVATEVTENRGKISKNTARINRTLRCLSVAKRPQSCIDNLVGASGPGGATGRAGARGGMGGRGLRGVRGETGERGPAGPAGARGARGRPGAVGPRGAPGEPGADGLNGIDGADGVDGVDGLPGVAGPSAPLVPCAAQPVELGYQCVPAPVVVP